MAYCASADFSAPRIPSTSFRADSALSSTATLAPRPSDSLTKSMFRVWSAGEW